MALSNPPAVGYLETDEWATTRGNSTTGWEEMLYGLSFLEEGGGEPKRDSSESWTLAKENMIYHYQ